MPPVPDTILHAPVPLVGLFPARATEVNPQVDAPVWSGPAAAAVGAWLKVIMTSSELAVHGAFEIVHLKVYVLPAMPVNVDVLSVGVVMVPPVPLTIVHMPVPITGVFPAKVTVVNPRVAELV